MAERVIFTFWEPRDKLIPYLELCLRTWKKNLRDYSIVVLDHSNLDDYVPRGKFDNTLLRQLTPPMQKDAISAAVLKEHGGVFMDVDTLVFSDLAPLLSRLESTELIMFGTHMAFLAARPNSLIVTVWLERIREKLARIAGKDSAGLDLPWDYIGNSALNAAMDGIVNRSALSRLQTQAVEKLTQLANRQTALGPGIRKVVNRAHDSFLSRRRRLAFKTICRQYLTVLDRKKQGYILEAAYYEAAGMSREVRRLGPEAKYVKYWFEEDLEVQRVIQSKPIVVGLHNSWTPQWYKELSEQQVLENGCLLSRTLRYILAG